MTNEEGIREICRAEGWVLGFAIETAFVRAGGQVMGDARKALDEILSSYDSASRAGDRFEALATLSESFGLRVPRVFDLARALKVAAQIVGAEIHAREMIAMPDYDPEDMTYGAAAMVARAQSVAHQCHEIVKDVSPAWQDAPGSPELTGAGYRFHSSAT